MTKSSLLGIFVFLGIWLLLCLFLSGVAIYSTFSPNQSSGLSDLIAVYVVAGCGYGLFWFLGRNSLELWRRANPDDPALIRTLQHLLPFYSVRIWEGRHGLEALAHNDSETAMMLWHSLADKGDPEAQYRLGLLHCSGECVDQTPHVAANLMAEAARQVHFSALRWLKRSARDGNADAQFELGKMYLEGDGVCQNNRRAYKHLAAAAENGHSEAEVESGRRNLQGIVHTRFWRFWFGAPPPNKLKAFELFQKSAASGNSRGKHYLGLAYELGMGTLPDHAKAFQLVSEAANDGLIIAQLNLARYHWMGEVTEKNRKLATQWFEIAKENIDERTGGDTCLSLAQLYIEGWCCEPDLEKGYYWTAIAYRDNPDQKAAELKYLEKKMDKDQIGRAKSLL